MTRRLPLLVTLSSAHGSPSPPCRPAVFLRAASTKSPKPRTDWLPTTNAYWQKHLNLDQNVPDDRLSNPGHTFFTSPGASKTAVLSMMQWLETTKDWKNAVVILASPRHASWLTDQNFMATFIRSLQYEQAKAAPGAKIHVLAAVVDGLGPQPQSREMREGLSVQLGSLDGLLPRLWDESSDETTQMQSNPVEPGSEFAHVSVVLKNSKHSGNRITVNLPLANTLFHNGRRTTFLASEWQVSTHGDQHLDLLRMKEKRVQTVALPVPPGFQKLPLHSPLVPITHPRKIVEGLGNILAKVEIEEEVSPASKEIQANIPRLLEVRRASSESKLDSGRIGVWALIIPGYMIESDRAAGTTSHGVTNKPPLASIKGIREGRLGTAVDKLAFEFNTPSERTAWQRCSVLGEILVQGGRLHKLLSGGGEWGAKASLLSLDPQTSYGVESEEDELDRFQRSFNGEDRADEAITKPGDYVQFFVEGDSDVGTAHAGYTGMPKAPNALPVAAFGVGEFSKEDYAAEQVEDSPRAQRGRVQLLPNHFGAFSAEGLYLDLWDAQKQKATTTKMDVPGSSIGPLDVVHPVVVDRSAAPRAPIRSGRRPSRFRLSSS